MRPATYDLTGQRAPRSLAVGLAVGAVAVTAVIAVLAVVATVSGAPYAAVAVVPLLPFPVLFGYGSLYSARYRRWLTGTVLVTRHAFHTRHVDLATAHVELSRRPATRLARGGRAADAGGFYLVCTDHATGSTESVPVGPGKHRLAGRQLELLAHTITSTANRRHPQAAAHANGVAAQLWQLAHAPPGYARQPVPTASHHPGPVDVGVAGPRPSLPVPDQVRRKLPAGLAPPFHLVSAFFLAAISAILLVPAVMAVTSSDRPWLGAVFAAVALVPAGLAVTELRQGMRLQGTQLTHRRRFSTVTVDLSSATVSLHQQPGRQLALRAHDPTTGTNVEVSLRLKFPVRFGAIAGGLIEPELLLALAAAVAVPGRRSPALQQHATAVATELHALATNPYAAAR